MYDFSLEPPTRSGLARRAARDENGLWTNAREVRSRGWLTGRGERKKESLSYGHRSACFLLWLVSRSVCAVA